MSRVVAASRRLLDEKGPESHGFYTSGQLFLEEYYALAIMAKAGLGTPHLDGNTRLCTATAAASLKESFGADGQPGTYEDLDHCEALFCYGHNMAETQTVLCHESWTGWSVRTGLRWSVWIRATLELRRLLISTWIFAPEPISP